MTDLTKNPDLRSREKIDDYFGDWKWREGLAELMVPIVGRLYRHGVHIMIYGQSLVNKSPIDIMHAHRFVRQIEENELSELETYPLLERLSQMDLPDCEVDIGELAMRCTFFQDLPNNPDSIDDFLQDQIHVDSIDLKRPDQPQDIVLYGFGRIGRLMARMLAQTTGPGNYFRLKGVVVRRTGENDLIKRASLLRRDSVHGRFDGTIRVDLENELLVINGNPVKFIYANSPSDVNYSDLNINSPIVIDNTGIWRDEDTLSQHLNCGASKVILTAPAKGDIRNIVFGVNDSALQESDKIISAASCTTNAIVPVLKLISDNYGISNGHIETVHSYTNDQNLIDNFHKGDRRGRSAPLNMVITSTGAVKAVAKAIPELKDKLTGNATQNKQAGVWTISVDAQNITTFTFTREVNNGDQVKVTFDNKIYYYERNATGGRAPEYTDVKDVDLSNAGVTCTFDGNDTRFYADTITHTGLDTNDVWIKFPRINAFRDNIQR